MAAGEKPKFSALMMTVAPPPEAVVVVTAAVVVVVVVAEVVVVAAVVVVVVVAAVVVVPAVVEVVVVSSSASSEVVSVVATVDAPAVATLAPPPQAARTTADPSKQISKSFMSILYASSMATGSQHYVARMSDRFMELAVDEARTGRDEGGIPIGSVLVADEKVVGAGHNRRVQRGSSILHAEMDAIENAGRLPASVYRRSTLYSTLSPCDMCSGMALLYGIPRIVIGENQTFAGPEAYLRSRGVELVILERDDCKALMDQFIAANPSLWNEDIGE